MDDHNLCCSYIPSSGFCTRVSAYELKDVKKSLGFIAASEDRSFTLHTTPTPKFLSRSPSIFHWPALNYGKDVIVSVIESGVSPESNIFEDDGICLQSIRRKSEMEPK